MLFEHLIKLLGIDVDSEESITIDRKASPISTYLISQLLQYVKNKYHIGFELVNINKNNDMTFMASKNHFAPPKKEKFFKNTKIAFYIKFNLFGCKINITYNRGLKRFFFDYTTRKTYDNGKLVVTRTNSTMANIETFSELNDGEIHIIHSKTEWDTLYIYDDKNTYNYFYSAIPEDYEIHFIYDKKKKTIMTNINFSKIKKSIRIKK